MRKKFIGTVALSFMLLISVSQTQAQIPWERDILFDSDWKFHRGGAQGAENPAFNDADWRDLDLPHDWSLEDLPGIGSPFSRDAISQVSGGFTTGGTGWYRKRFTIPENMSDKHIRLRFDGVYMNSEVFVNGRKAGTHPYGYSSFWFDISGFLNPTGENLIAVKVKNEGENSRWYSGSGIYRHVWLDILPPVHIETWGTSISASGITKEEAVVNIETSITNEINKTREITLVTTITDNRSVQVARTESAVSINPGQQVTVKQRIPVSDPQLWNIDSPELYKAISQVFSDGSITDTKETIFGIRSVSFDITNGFMLNGRPLKLMGGCVHHDNGPLGARAYDRAEERRIELLKASGFNAIRCSHNPPSPAFLDACDRLGMLVIDEAFDMWDDPKNPHDYHLWFKDWWKKDITNMIMRDRNHPSVIMWSSGNEIPGRHTPEVVERSRTIADFIRKSDPGRPVTAAVNDLRPDKDPYFSTLDIAGYNYASGGDHNQENIYEQDHIRVPDRIMMGTESYPLEAFSAWMDVKDNSYVTGDFVWTAFDYIGEASIGWRGYWQKQDFFPWNLAWCGDIDICGWKRPQSYYRDVLWKPDQISIWVVQPEPSFPQNPERQSWSKWHWADVTDNWNWKGKEGIPMEINVYSSCQQVELFLNGTSLGKKVTDRSTRFIATWMVPYQQGTLKAVGYNRKKKVREAELKSTGDASGIRLSPDRNRIIANGQDLSYITVELTDNSGIRVPDAENHVSFTIDGPGSIVAVGNANPVSLESYTLPERKAWRGKCMVIIKSGNTPGTISLKANSKGMEQSEIIIESTLP